MGFFKSWKTTLAGVVTIGLQVLTSLNVIIPDLAHALMLVAISLGLIAAKDGNVTGGTVQQ